jgi:hypothetical protein
MEDKELIVYVWAAPAGGWDLVDHDWVREKRRPGSYKESGMFATVEAG